MSPNYYVEVKINLNDGVRYELCNDKVFYLMRGLPNNSDLGKEAAKYKFDRIDQVELFFYRNRNHFKSVELFIFDVSDHHRELIFKILGV